MSHVFVVVGTVLAGLAALLSLLVWGNDAAVDVGLVLSAGFAGATCIGVGLLIGR